MFTSRILFKVLSLISKFNPSWKKNRFCGPQVKIPQSICMYKKLAVNGAGKIKIGN
jgi:hypothetical protein